ncbi:MAG: ROK family protein [Bacillota bacterium]|jgi:glucokinase
MSIVAVDLGGTNLRVGLLRRERVLWKRQIATEAERGKEHIISNMSRLIRLAMQESRRLSDQVEGIGVGLPGPVNPATGVVDSPPNLPGWEQVPLGDLLTRQFSLPVYLNNDANAAALGEWLYGAGQGYEHLVYVTISTGIGGGVISSGVLLTGASGGAAEIGHMCIQAVQGVPCGCGREGCFEAYASGNAMVRYAQEKLSRAEAASSLLHGLEPLTPKEIGQAAAAGDLLAGQVLERCRRYLAVGLANVLTLYDPQVLILGGGLTNLWSQLIVPVLPEMRRLTFAANAEHLAVVRPALEGDAGLVGAAALVSYAGSRQ